MPGTKNRIFASFTVLSHRKLVHICVWISSPENIDPVYKTYMFFLGEKGEGFKRNDMWKEDPSKNVMSLSQGRM